jgi:putative peptide zinc metalloprotease protein
MALQEPVGRPDGSGVELGPRWVRSEGVILLGEASGTGLTKPVFLVRRSDGQVAQLTEVLYRVLENAGAPRTPEDLSARVTNVLGKQLDVEGLSTLVGRLEPIGLLRLDDVPLTSKLVTAKPLLALTVKGTLIPTKAVQLLGDVFRPLFATPVIVAAVGALMALNVFLFVTTDALSALQQVLVTPSMILALYSLLLAGTVFHEIGHAAACRYGGGRPGVIGVGLYLVFPAFFTDVTDSYRLGRAGRIRTDLGGLYFHLLWVLAAGTGFILTHSPLLLLLVIATQLQMLQQLPPFVRLDGYFVLADLAGVPDLFARVRPVLRSLLPGRAADPRVAELKPYSRRIVTVWVLVVVPFLAIVLGWLTFLLPVMITQAADAVTLYLANLGTYITEGRIAEAALVVVALVLLLLPVVGLCAVLTQLAATAVRLVSARLATRRQQRSGVGRHVRRNPRHRQAPLARAS